MRRGPYPLSVGVEAFGNMSHELRQVLRGYRILSQFHSTTVCVPLTHVASTCDTMTVG